MSLFSCAQPNTTKFDTETNLICRSKCKCTQHFNQCCRREEGSHARGAEPFLNLRRGRVPHLLLINDRIFCGSIITIFPLASFINGKTYLVLIVSLYFVVK